MPDRTTRNGVYFDCENCGKLLRERCEHNPAEKRACPGCGGDLLRVGVGNHMVGNATWHRCMKCAVLFMRRRGETVPTTPRAGFAQFT